MPHQMSGIRKQYLLIVSAGCNIFLNFSGHHRKQLIYAMFLLLSLLYLQSKSTTMVK